MGSPSTSIPEYATGVPVAAPEADGVAKVEVDPTAQYAAITPVDKVIAAARNINSTMFVTKDEAGANALNELEVALKELDAATTGGN